MGTHFKKSRRDCLLAAVYQGGIPRDYPDWEDRLKQVWVDNIPYVLAEIEAAKLELDVRTPHGLAKLIELRTGDKELADKVLSMARVRLAEKAIPALAKKMFGG